MMLNFRVKMKPNYDFDVSTPVEYVTKDGEKKTRWNKCGVGWKNKDSITIQMDVVPLNGKLVLKEPKDFDIPQQGETEQEKQNPLFM